MMANKAISRAADAAKMGKLLLSSGCTVGFAISADTSSFILVMALFSVLSMACITEESVGA